MLLEQINVKANNIQIKLTLAILVLNNTQTEIYMQRTVISSRQGSVGIAWRLFTLPRTFFYLADTVQKRSDLWKYVGGLSVFQ